MEEESDNNTIILSDDSSDYWNSKNEENDDREEGNPDDQSLISGFSATDGSNFRWRRFKFIHHHYVFTVKTNTKATWDDVGQSLQRLRMTMSRRHTNQYLDLPPTLNNKFPLQEPRFVFRQCRKHYLMPWHGILQHRQNFSTTTRRNATKSSTSSPNENSARKKIFNLCAVICMYFKLKYFFYITFQPYA